MVKYSGYRYYHFKHNADYRVNADYIYITNNIHLYPLQCSTVKGFRLVYNSTKEAVVMKSMLLGRGCVFALPYTRKLYISSNFCRF